MPFILVPSSHRLLLFCYLFGLNVKSFALLIHKISSLCSLSFFYILSNLSHRFSYEMVKNNFTISGRSWYGGGLWVGKKSWRGKRGRRRKSWKSLWISPPLHSMIHFHYILNSHEKMRRADSTFTFSLPMELSGKWAEIFTFAPFVRIIHQIFHAQCSLQLNEIWDDEKFS